MKTKRKKRKYKGRLLLCILSLLLGMTGCGKENRQTDVPEEQATRGTETTEANTAAPVSEAVTEAATEAAEEGTLTEIKIPEKQGMFCTDTALEDRDHALLLYMIPDAEGRITSCCVDRLNLLDGTAEAVMESLSVAPGGESGGRSNCIFLQLDPLILYDLSESNLIFSETGKVWHPEYEGSAYYLQSFAVDGTVYILDSDLSLNRVIPDGEEPRLEQVSTTPEGYESLRVAGFSAAEAVFLATPAWNEEESEVYISVNLSTGEVGEPYTTDRPLPEPSIAVNEGFLVEIPFGKQSEFHIDTEERHYTLASAGDASLDTAIRDRTANITAGQYSVCDGAFLFKAEWGEMEPKQKYILWTFPKESGEERKPAEHKPFTPPLITEETNREFEEELEKEFGIEIYTGKEAKSELHGFQMTQEEDPLLIRRTLYRLRDVLKKYPKSLFSQLTMDGRQIQIHIVADITGSVMDAGGLKWDEGEDTGLVLTTAGHGAEKQTMFHEITHLIYSKLQNDSVLSEAEDAWMALNPPGFTYTGTYEGYKELETNYTTASSDMGVNYENVYFIGVYNKTYETEDVADMVAYLMCGETPPEYFRSPHLQEKCRYFFRLIREGFDTSGWPEKTYWEERLEQIP